MSSVHSPEEQMMVESLNRNLYSEEFIAMLNSNWEKNHNLHYLGDLIGEAYNFHVLFKDGEGFLEYMQKMNEIYNDYHENMENPNLSKEDKRHLAYMFERERATVMASAIANKLGIDINNPSKEDSLRVKEYFLREFVEKGYVSHSFPDAYTESIMEKGLVASSSSRGTSNDDKMEIQRMFLEHGIVTPLGAYPFYGGSGIYYEDDFRSVFHHAVESPEWFKWFTSSDHMTTYQPGVENSPYVLRDEAMCRRNVEDLCTNAEMSPEETERVMDFYNKYYQLYRSPQLKVALIPKSVVGKDDVSELGVEDKGVVDTISSVLRDEKKQYEEHIGNVSHADIPADSFVVTSIPSADCYITPPREYYREGKEHITDRDASLAMIERIQGNDRLVPEMRTPLEEAKVQIASGEKKAPAVSKEESEEVFDQRSPEEIQVADAIRKENEAIAKKKVEAKQLDKPYVYTMKKKDDKPSGNGFVSSITVSIIIGMLIAMMVTILCLIVL